MATDKKIWINRISAAWQKSVDGIFEAGEALMCSKMELSHGDFLKMVQNELPFGPRTAQALMEIARHDRLQEFRKTNPGSLLPQSWRVLWELARLNDKVFEAALAGGTIRPNMSRSEIAPRRSQDEPHEVETAHVVYATDEATRDATTDTGNVVARKPWATGQQTREVLAPFTRGETYSPEEARARDCASRLIDALIQADPAAVEKLLRGERAADLAVVRNAVFELGKRLPPPLIN